MKIKITESQYNRLLLNEEKEINFNYDVDTILGFAKFTNSPKIEGNNNLILFRVLIFRL